MQLRKNNAMVRFSILWMFFAGARHAGAFSPANARVILPTTTTTTKLARVTTTPPPPRFHNGETLSIDAPCRRHVAHQWSSPTHRASSNRDWRWDGDDMRYFSRLRRRLRRLVLGASGEGRSTVRNTLVLLNLLLYSYQTVDTTALLARQFRSLWPQQAPFILWDVLWGQTPSGPLTKSFLFIPSLANMQPHRYLTSGFLHGSLLHLLLNMNALLRQPAWLETGLGGSLFLATYLTSIVTGNVGHRSFGVDGAYRSGLGASGGICGLYGLMFVALAKMGNGRAAGQVFRGMALLILYGVFVDGISNAAHVGGFLGGAVVGLLCSPGYTSSYTMRRKGSLEFDSAPREFRAAMGFGVRPTRRGWIPMSWFWMAVLLVGASNPRWMAIPTNIVKGLLQPSTFASRVY